MAKKLRAIEGGGEKITVKNEIFRPNADPFMMVWGKVTSYEKLPANLIMKVVRITKKFNEAHDVWQEAWKKLIDQLAKKDDTGKIAPMKDKDGKEKPNTFEIADEHKEAWGKAMEELDAVEVEIGISKLTLGSLLGAGLLLSPQEVLILDDVLEHTE